MRNYRLAALAAFAAALVPAAPAAAKVVKQDAGGFVTRETVVVEASPRDAWMALISPAKWWDKAHTWSGDSANLSITPQAGGCFCERIPEVDTRDKVGLAGSVQHMTVVYAAPDAALRMRGALGPLQSEAVTGVLTIAFEKTDKGTAITFEYVVGGYMRYEADTISKAVDGVMTQQLNGLAALLGPVEAPAAPAPKKAAPAAKPVSKPIDDAGDEHAAPAEAKSEEPKESVEDAFGDLSKGDDPQS